MVGYSGHGPNWNLSVKDDGIGMPSDPDSAKPGLGSSIIQALATQLGARITITPGNPGTSVSVAHHFVAVLAEQGTGTVSAGHAV